MIELYTWGTPNGRKVSIMLEECALPYRVHKIDIMQGEQFAPAYLAINPNGKIPSIVDPDGPDEGSGGTKKRPLRMMESGAILVYLALKSGKFYPAENRTRILEWLMWQMSAVGPMLGRAHYFLKYNPGKAPFAEEWFSAEAKRLYGVLDRLLSGQDFMCGDYSIADMATFPWIARHEWQRINLNDFPNVKRWYQAIAARPAVRKGYKVPNAADEIPMPA